MQLLASLGHPDKPHFPNPPSWSSQKKKVPSQLLRQERRWEGAVAKLIKSILESYD